MKLKYIILFLILIISCTPNEKFTKGKWDDIFDGDYRKRPLIVDDLIDNVLDSTYCYHDIKNLLGKTSRPGWQPMEYRLYFTIEEDWGWDIDPNWEKFLVIELNQDSCFKKAYVKKL